MKSLGSKYNCSLATFQPCPCVHCKNRDFEGIDFTETNYCTKLFSRKRLNRSFRIVLIIPLVAKVFVYPFTKKSSELLNNFRNVEVDHFYWKIYNIQSSWIRFCCSSRPLFLRICFFMSTLS
ncbi:unnamed protein product [Moneuplotes crassus]|uniref:Uncharacterized protein n=1 Tax=Euplotes crassus TaxID=5936 RepID=A0AAD1UEE6_EUPCR|nr:unnamed protein product [Moneuplotes crassus]